MFLDTRELQKRRLEGAIQLAIPLGSIQKSRIDLEQLRYIWPDGSSNAGEIACGVYTNGIYDRGLLDNITEIIEPVVALDTVQDNIVRARRGDSLS